MGEHSGKISAGSFELNKWLAGGYETDIATVIYGGPGSGKTNLCLLAAVSQAKKDRKVIFIDTEGGFSVGRVKQMASEDSERVLKNILLLKPTNFDEQKKVFDSLSKYLKDEISLIVVDSMTILYRLDFADAREKIGENKENNSDEKRGSLNGEMQKINSDLVRQIKILTEIARKQQIPVIVTSQVYRWADVDKVVGGDILKYWGKCLIELVNDNGRRTAYLKKHRSMPEKSFAFQINDSGLKKRGWI